MFVNGVKNISFKAIQFDNNAQALIDKAKSTPELKEVVDSGVKGIKDWSRYSEWNASASSDKLPCDVTVFSTTGHPLVTGHFSDGSPKSVKKSLDYMNDTLKAIYTKKF